MDEYDREIAELDEIYKQTDLTLAVIGGIGAGFMLVAALVVMFV